MNLIGWSSFNKETKEAFVDVLDTMKHAFRGLSDLKQDDLGSFLTSISVPKFPQKTQKAWLQYTKDIKGVPDVQTLFTFMQ